MKISSKPTLTLEMLFKPTDGPRHQVFPFNTGRCTYYYSGRYALAAAIRALKLSTQQTVLLPSYNCWVEVDPVVSQGVKADWYRVNKDFTIDLDDIVNRIKPETAAILVIHYLGFPQQLLEIRRICTERGIILIEDCAHALLSNDGNVPLGSVGDMAIFSPRKTLPLPDGGCLLINNATLTSDRTREVRPNLFSTYFVLSEMLCGGSTLSPDKPTFSHRAYSFNLKMARIARFGLKGVHKVWRDRGEYLVYPSGNIFRDNVISWGISKRSATIIENADFEFIKRSRRANFKYLLEHFMADDRFELPIRSLPDGVCPLLFPIFVRDRDRIYRQLKDRGLSGHDWWGDFHPVIPWEDFPDAVYLKKYVFGFPVHQDLTLDNLELMLAEFCKSFVK